MPDYINFYLKYKNEFEEICKEKNLNKKGEELLQQWFFMLFLYTPNMDLVNHASLEEYIEKYLQSLRNMNNLSIYTLEEVLNDESNILHIIKQVPKTHGNAKYAWRLKKENGKYILDDNGEFYLEASGICGIEDHNIALIDDNETINSLQHELTHINQGENKYDYPSKLPFFYDIKKMLREAEANSSERIMNGDVFFAFYDWNEYNIQSYSYHFYYQIYIMLMFILPKEMKKDWEEGNFNVTHIPEQQKDFFSNLFAIITILVAKSNLENTDEVFEESINICYQDCLPKLVQADNDFIKARQDELKIEEQIALCRIQEIEIILNNPNLFKEEYLKKIEAIKKEILELEDVTEVEREELLNELKNEGTSEEYASSLRKEIDENEEHIKNYQEKRKPENLLNEEDYKNYCFRKFGIDLTIAMKQLLEQKFTIAELFQMLVKKVENYLIEMEGKNEKLAFIELLKNPSFDSQKII